MLTVKNTAQMTPKEVLKIELDRIKGFTNTSKKTRLEYNLGKVLEVFLEYSPESEAELRPKAADEEVKQTEKQ